LPFRAVNGLVVPRLCCQTPGLGIKAVMRKGLLPAARTFEILVFVVSNHVVPPLPHFQMYEDERDFLSSSAPTMRDDLPIQKTHTWHPTFAIKAQSQEK